MTKTRRSMAIAAMLLAAAAGACADGTARLSPVGPSPVSLSSEPTAEGTGAAAWASARGWVTTAADGRVAVADGLQVEGTDVVGSVSGACPALTISIRGVAVAVTASTRFAAPLTCASLGAGQTVKVTGVLLPSAGGFSVVATQLAAVAMPEAVPPANVKGAKGEKARGEGTVGAVSGSCPALTFVIGGHRVQATPETAWAGGTCESLREGAHVRLEVEKHEDGSILAEHVEILRVPGRRE